MDLDKVKQLRRSLTLHFAIIAVLTAMLVAAGSGTIFLPVFILMVSVAAFVFVDVLEWFELGRIGSAVGMTVVTTVSIASYLYSAFSLESESGQLMAIAGLLVYPEAVLFLQRKNLRVYEQLAIFLLLEMVVAALVNDNILFGILLAPIMLLWVSSLFIFSRYATLVHIDPNIETPMATFAELLLKRVVRSVMGENDQQPVVSAQLLPSRSVQSSRALRRGLQSFPIGIGALVFAGLFFYLLPRTAPSKFQPGIGNTSTVGLPSRLTFKAVGKILQNREPVMRVTLTHAQSGEPFELRSPPYFRALVFNRYGSNARNSMSQGEWHFTEVLRHRRMPNVDRFRGPKRFGREFVHVRFDVKRQYASLMYTLPPVFATGTQQKVRLRYDPAQMLLRKLDEGDVPHGKSLIYDIGSAAFAGREQIPVMPAHLASRPSSRGDGRASRQIADLKSGFFSFIEMDRYRTALLADAGIDQNDRFAAARSFESHFLAPDRFTYSLDIRAPSDPDIDPIEDFLLNQRTGHCQYFASAMVAMMRQTGIASRIVVGYRPSEFNELGDYFVVRQSDAHAWVEGLFTREELVGTEYERWLTDSEDYWVRFDPTPGGDGQELGIVRQQGQAMDYAEQLWKEYVVEGQKLGAENSLYAPVAENSKGAYDDIVKQLNQIRDNIQKGRFWSTNVGFAWQLAAVVIGVGCAALFLWRLFLLLPRIAPRLALRLGVVQTEFRPQHRFYARCLSLLERLRVPRREFETPLEFTADAGEILNGKGQQVGGSLNYLTSLYYDLRFGRKEMPTPDEKKTADSELKQLEDAVSAARRTT